MRYPAEETAEKHQRILTAAARLFREQGFDGVTVGQIMQATGLTHGPFYNHFASKEALMAESTLHGSEHSRVALDAASASPEAMRQYVRDYVSTAHRDAPGDGCLLAALAGDVRKQPAVRPAFTFHLKTIIGKLAAQPYRPATQPWRRLVLAGSNCAQISKPARRDSRPMGAVYSALASAVLKIPGRLTPTVSNANTVNATQGSSSQSNNHRALPWRQRAQVCGGKPSRSKGAMTWPSSMRARRSGCAPSARRRPSSRRRRLKA